MKKGIGYIIKRKLRYFYMRTLIKTRRDIENRLTKREIVTELDLVAQEAIRKAIWEKDSILYEYDSVRYVKVPSKKINVIMEDHYALIANSVYSYRFHINEDIYKHLCEVFDNTIEKRALKIDKEVYNNVKTNIKLILKEI
jgi:hypothetical protein